MIKKDRRLKLRLTCWKLSQIRRNGAKFEKSFFAVIFKKSFNVFLSMNTILNS